MFGKKFLTSILIKISLYICASAFLKIDDFGTYAFAKIEFVAYFSRYFTTFSWYFLNSPFSVYVTIFLTLFFVLIYFTVSCSFIVFLILFVYQLLDLCIPHTYYKRIVYFRHDR